MPEYAVANFLMLNFYDLHCQLYSANTCLVSFLKFDLFFISERNVEGNVATSDSAELFVTRRLESLHLTINLESGALLPLALR